MTQRSAVNAERTNSRPLRRPRRRPTPGLRDAVRGNESRNGAWRVARRRERALHILPFPERARYAVVQRKFH